MSPRIRIADLTLDTGRRTLARGQQKIPLGPLTYKLLLALVEVAPEIATHDYLADSVWRGRVVSPGTISQRIKLLRDALSDDAANPRYIQVLHGQGYRLIPPVNALPAENGDRRRRIGLAGVAASLALVAVLAAFKWFGAVPDDTSHNAGSVAVLPFVDMSPEQDQEYFADGIAEEILNLLAVTNEVRVIARTSSFSFKGRNADIGTIRDVLNVAHVLEGSVRKYGDSVRISAHLVDTGTGERIWSDTFDREVGDILLLQSEIAASVAAALKVELLGAGESRHAAIETVNPDAFDFYLRGLKQLSVLSEASLLSASRNFQQAIDRDPSFAQAYYGLGMADLWQVIAAVVPQKEYRLKIREVVDRGLALAPDHAGLTALEGVLAFYDRDFALAEERLRRAMMMKPSDVWIRTMYAGLKLDQSFPREALETASLTYELDPLNWLPYTTLVFSNIDLANADEALKSASRLAEVSPADDANGASMSGLIKILLRGDMAGGIRDWMVVTHENTFSHERTNMLAIAFYSIGDTRQGDFWLEKALQEAPGRTFTRAVQAYRAVIDGDIARGREIALDAVIHPDQFTRWWGGTIALRLAVEALIEQGEAARAVDLMLELAPEWARYMAQPDIGPEEFSPAPFEVKSSYSSYPALYFPDFIRALSASGQDVAAQNMLGHLEAILEWRRERGLLVEEVHAAEASALRNNRQAALDALEKAERDGTIYNFWQLRLLHNGIFSQLRDQPRYKALVNRVSTEMSRQRKKLGYEVSVEGLSGS